MANDGAADTMNPFLAEVLNTQGGKLVLQCYQCGTCSGSCPVIDEMEYGPRRILYLIQSGKEAEVLSSKDPGGASRATRAQIVAPVASRSPI